MYSNWKAWIPIIGINYACLEIFCESWINYQIVCLVNFSFILVALWYY